MGKVSIIIPSRSPEFLQRTIDDLLAKARGEVEVVVVLDGVWPEPMPLDNPRVVLVHHGEAHDNVGMRGSINAGMRVATGDYVLKLDEHTMVDEGYDLKLQADCEPDWIVIPRRRRLLPDNWTLQEDGRPPVDYMKLDYPYERPYDKTCGLHGSEDKARSSERQNIPIDDVMTGQGSAYFLHRAYWHQLFPDGLDDIHYGTFTQEAQEVTLTCWLSGGRVVVNKQTWYAHYHKGRRGKGYGFSNEQYKRHLEGTERGRRYCIDHWLHTKDYPHDFDWLMAKFWPVAGWPENWREQIEVDKVKDFSATYGEKYEPTWQ